MTQYVVPSQDFPELASSPASPGSGHRRVFGKSDDMYEKDSAGVETALGAVSTGGEATSHIWTPGELSLSANATLATFTNVMVTPTARLHTSIISDAGTPWWSCTQEFIDALNGGKDVFLQFGVEAAGTGDVELELMMGHWDESDDSFVSETRNQTITIAASGKMQVIEQEFSALSAFHIPSIDDWFQFRIKRVANDVADTLAFELHLMWLKILPKSGGVS